MPSVKRNKTVSERHHVAMILPSNNLYDAVDHDFGIELNHHLQPCSTHFFNNVISTSLVAWTCGVCVPKYPVLKLVNRDTIITFAESLTICLKHPLNGTSYPVLNSKDIVGDARNFYRPPRQKCCFGT